MALCSVLSVSGVAFAQAAPWPEPQNVLQLSASGTVEVQQDLLSMSLTTTREGSEAAAVQTQLKTALDAALAEAKRNAQPGLLDVRTGSFSLSPRYSREGKINGWQGSAELILEGRDFPRITQTAGSITTLTVGGIGFGLSREQRAKVEADRQLQAEGGLAGQGLRLRRLHLARGVGQRQSGWPGPPADDGNAGFGQVHVGCTRAGGGRQDQRGGQRVGLRATQAAMSPCPDAGLGLHRICAH
jgi:hypothetical protein